MPLLFLRKRLESRIRKSANIDIHGDLAEQDKALDLIDENHQGRNRRRGDKEEALLNPEGMDNERTIDRYAFNSTRVLDGPFHQLLHPISEKSGRRWIQCSLLSSYPCTGRFCQSGAAMQARIRAHFARMDPYVDFDGDSEMF
jgi:hypothetical protein